MHIRTGIGFDVHQLAGNKKLILGGIEIPHTKGCIAHSDGDVLIHAICDALLGALGLGDIGAHFPDTDMRYKDIASTKLLAEVNRLIAGKGFSICNIDSVICLQQPRLREYISSIQTSIAGILEIDPGDVSVKATTTEKLGFVGREEGIAAQAVVLLLKK
jgi:2-C-methyl-D-erythritol 2,4-cyclodiphosphate synthase